MKKLTIDNIGPVVHAELDLKQVNVIIGPQASGKSCILKIASFCAWVEKHILLTCSFDCLNDKDFMRKELVEFHKLEGLMREDSHFHYKTEYVDFEYDHSTGCSAHNWNDQRWKYERRRVSYIPAERNILSVIPNILDVRLSEDYVKSFVSDWNMVRKFFSLGKPLSIVDLNAKYHYDATNNNDYIDVPDCDPILLTNASSGIQSLVPMCSYLDFLFDKQYTDTLLSSPNADLANQTFHRELFSGKYQAPLSKEECEAIYTAYTKTHHSDIFLEEPELNIFPQTQVSLTYYLLERIKLHQDNLFLATHSHYILYAINNCMIGHLVSDAVKESENEDLLRFQNSWIDPQLVGVWELDNGKLKAAEESPSNTIQDKYGLIRGNYFDRVMHNIMADFTNLMNYYE